MDKTIAFSYLLNDVDWFKVKIAFQSANIYILRGNNGYKQYRCEPKHPIVGESDKHL